jgi:hypothetical protein
MTEFAVITPFSLNWKFVVPHDYERLEYFVTPRVSLLFHEITNGKQDFVIGSFLINESNKDKFMNEILPQRSNQRIQKAFEDENVSAFLNREDAEICEQLFRNEGFFCHRLSILLDGTPVDLRTLPADEFYETIETLSALKVVSVMDFEENATEIADMVTETRKLIEEGIRKEESRKRSEKKGFTKRVANIRGALGTASMVASVACGIGAKKMVRKGGLLGFAIASVCTILGFGFASIGKSLAGDSIQYYMQGMVRFGV